MVRVPSSHTMDEHIAHRQQNLAAAAEPLLSGHGCQNAAMAGKLALVMQECSVLLQHLQNIWGQNHMLRHHLLPWGQLYWPCISWPSVHVLYRQHVLFGTVECQGWLLHAGKAKLACRHIWSNWACSDMQLFGHCTWPCGPYVMTICGAETYHITINKVSDGHHQELGFAGEPLASASVSRKKQI